MRLKGPRFDNLRVANDFLSEAPLCDYLVICKLSVSGTNAGGMHLARLNAGT